MSSTIKAYPDEYNELKAEMEKLHKSITLSLDNVNSQITQMTSVTGPFYSNRISPKIQMLMSLLRAHLHATNTIYMQIMLTCLTGFTNGLNSRDKATG
jgi:hypothetical protein